MGSTADNSLIPQPEAEDHPYVATYRAIIVAPDEVTANVWAERLREEAMTLLDEEEGDDVILTSVTDTAINLPPEETLVILKRARNALIRTRIKQCFDQARGLDEIIHYLGRRLEPGDLAAYDYGRLLEIMEDILIKGNNPI